MIPLSECLTNPLEDMRDLMDDHIRQETCPHHWHGFLDAITEYQNMICEWLGISQCPREFLIRSGIAKTDRNASRRTAGAVPLD